MAARLEEKQGDPHPALELLEQGLETSPHSAELHFRVAKLMARLYPGRSQEIRQHFEAALLGPIRNYWPRLTYAAYLFSCGEFYQSSSHFAAMDDLVVSNRERFEVHHFRFGELESRHSGAIRRLSDNYSSVEFKQGATEVYIPRRNIAQNLATQLDVEVIINFRIGFNLKGPLATDITLEK